MRHLKQSTSVELTIGPFVDTAGAAVTTLTIANTDIALWKHGVSSFGTKNSGGATHKANGFYSITFDSTDTNTLGNMRLACKSGTALIVWEDFAVQPANVWDTLYGADLFQVDLTQVLGGAVPAVSQTGVPKVDLAYSAGTAITSTGGIPSVNTTQVAGAAQTAGDIIGDTNDIQTRLPASLVSGRIDASVGAMAANTVTAAAIASAAIDADSIASDAITAAKIATDAIGSDELAATATTEIAAAIKAAVVETAGSITLQQALSVILAAVAGVTTTNGAVFKTSDGTAVRITSTPDASNNRTSITLAPSA